MSIVAKQIAGTRIPESSAAPAHAWLQNELRSGSLHKHVQKFIASRPEILDASLLVVDSVTPDSIHCRIPVALFDHETVGAFTTDLEFTVNPLTGDCIRLEPSPGLG